MAEAIRFIHLQHTDHSLYPILHDADEPLRYTQPLDVSYRVLNRTISNQ
ncbi:unnamed protein product, partial [Adineta steineri]